MFSLEEPINKVIDKLKDDKNYYGDYGKQYLSNSNIRSLINSPNEFKNFIGEDFNNLQLQGIYNLLKETLTSKI